MKKLFCGLLAALMLLSLSACGGKAPAETTAAAEAAPVDLFELYTAMADKLPEMIAMDDAMLMNFCGIEPDMYTQAVAAVGATGLMTDEVWLIEAVDEENLNKIEELANTRLKMKAEETESYAPDQYEIVKEAKLIKSGLYLALIVAPEAEALAQVVTNAIG